MQLVSFKIFNLFLNKINNKGFDNFFPNLDIYSLKRNYKPLRIFLSYENIHENLPKYDFSFHHDLGIVNENHFRFPIWKEHINWSHEGIFRDDTLTSKRFGSLWKLDDLLQPQGLDFLKKKRDVCFITSHMIEPKMSIYLKFAKHFQVDGYGPYFDKEIKHHNSSKFFIKDILKNYAFNLCPENSLYPGYYNERVPNAFLSKSLPITWADNNISFDFNPKAFINLIDYTTDNYESICHLLKDDNFLKKFIDQPLLNKKINLDAERNFVNKILSNFQ